ncbi:MAG: NADH-dependent [FeFe] hydrogenase, group A6 [Sphaerochaetaceae bacterium]|jgi:iron-only hydrogenase group A|nr:NADH-dependent [FeFe] hydrogenase, group A6 [Sphaerochaetaceae bacterium]NLO59965.1 4Fe-4S dicluster domain-containing protein [Spirochaetales bacterium]MDD2405106.1 NADH-dependent [FeFe] hydrogenase, group A6 [Sphaerochaetaceae bacterium]MDD4258974.1 NADH-dependent [FeFe] hydrogenase, group A6 [Sphaerochaetaceae bacterium]MDD4763029.1 NADH-dependent [FeFe] hydrogenase, group A6 [Sphaerochaetaceae bacterium]
MAEGYVNVTIDSRQISVQKGTTILNACRAAGVNVPTLCHLDDVSTNASCGICVVEVKGAKRLLRSCTYSVWPDMEVYTNTERVRKARKTNLELLLANHPLDCLNCDRNQNCELQSLAYELGVRQTRFPRTKTAEIPLDISSPALIRDPNKCILCGRCVAVCAEVQTVHAIDFTGRGLSSKVTTFLDKGLGNVACTNCGQCALVCPTGAIIEKSDVEAVWKDIANPDLITIVQTAPAIRVGIGEAMGMDYGALVTGQMVAGLRRLGFSKVFDTQFAADLTIIEEGHEFIKRLSTGGTLPMITSCSPGWIKFIEHFYPEQLDHLSTCKSPQQMFGAVAKTFYAEKLNIDPRKLRVVSIMPCTAKKYEAGRSEMDGAFKYWKEKLDLCDEERFADVDYALTTRELARMFKEVGINFAQLPEEPFDNPLGTSTGAAVIFGATGGVMEAALRTVYEVLTGTSLEQVDFKDVRGMEGIKEAEVTINGTPVKVAVAHTLSNARKVLEEIKNGKSPYAFIEVMTCPGGCLGGGGQPIPTTWEIRKKRAESIYQEDINLGIRKSHENPEIKALYDEFLGQPLGLKSHHLLHTRYTPRGII